MRVHWIAAFCLSLAMIIVGSSIIVSKLLIVKIPIFLLCFLRFFCALCVLIPLLVFREGKLPRLSRNMNTLLFYQALTGIFLFNCFLLAGLHYTSALNASIITSSTPAITTLLACLLLREKLTSFSIYGILLSVIGLLLINTTGHIITDSLKPVFGNSLIFSAVVAESLFTVLGKTTTATVSPLTSTTYVSIFGALLFSPPALYQLFYFDLLDLSVADLLLILYSGVVVTALAFILWFKGLAGITANTAAVFTALIPLSAVLLSSIFLNESLHSSHLVGSTLILGGLFLSVKKAPIPQADITTERARRL